MARETRESMRPETAKKRRAILDVALQVFGTKGYQSGTLADIAEVVGITHAGILHHFGTKDQLLLEVLKHRDTTDVERTKWDTIPLGLEFFQHLVTTAFENAQRAGITQAYAVLSAESVTENNPSREYFIERYRNLRDEAIKSFEIMCESLTYVDPKSAKMAAASILAVMDGLQVQWLLDPENVQLGENTRFAINAIVRQVVDPAQPIV